jgi:hypothetical protein
MRGSGQFLSLRNIAENSATFDYIAGLGCNRQKSALSELRAVMVALRFSTF